MIDMNVVEVIDTILDERIAQIYKDQPLGQDWARVAKVIEEAGEAVNELILMTGQNPRKDEDPAAYDRLLAELADTAMTAVYAIQHFTKNTSKTAEILRDAQIRHVTRLRAI